MLLLSWCRPNKMPELPFHGRGFCSLLVGGCVYATQELIRL